VFLPAKSTSNRLCKRATHFGWEPTRDANKRPPSVLLRLRAGAKPLAATLAARSSAAAPGPFISPVALPPPELVAGRAALSPRLFFSSPMLFQAAAVVQPAGSVPVWPRPDPWPWGLDPLPLWPDLWSALLGGAAVAAGPTARRCDDGGSFGSTASSSSSSVVQAEVDVDGSACSAAGSVRRWLDLVAAAELASLQYFRRLDSARVAGGRVQSWLPRPSLRRIRWCSGWIWRRRGGWPSAASGRALV